MTEGTSAATPGGSSPSAARAHAFVRDAFPQAEAAFLGGSTASGEATPSSDLDVLVVLPERWSPAAFVETTRTDGQLVEAFVYGPASLRVWLDKGRAERRPVLDHLIADGMPLTDNALTRELAARSREALAAGPAPADPEELRRRAYTVSAALDDLDDLADRVPDSPGPATSARDPELQTIQDAETAVLSWTLWRETAELALLTDGRWLGSGKWLLRELQRHGDHDGLVAWAGAGRPDPGTLVALARRVLESAGGYLQEGYLRGYRPPGL